MTHQPCVSTFSIVARDPGTGDFGIAVQSKFFGVGAVVGWAEACVGAVATQAHANTSWGTRALALLQAGWAAPDVISYLTATDPGRDVRQIGLVDRAGNAANFTGPGCSPWAGGKTGDGYCVQGNILVSQDTTEAMADAYESTSGPFAHRLISALQAGQIAGGDSRGQQSAAIYIVRERAGYGGGTDRLLDLHVEDHPTPIEELRRLYEVHSVYFGTDDVVLVPLTDPLNQQIAARLAELGYLDTASGVGSEAVAGALEKWAGAENLEERIRTDDQIDAVLLRFLGIDQ
ncbi:MAG: DUF1028 domain-containing protein [Sphaerobacteraceae bacterium]|nr:MAG: DUF1028 domain-containing protein [Sphaerobacteraceae bacterium]